MLLLKSRCNLALQDVHGGPVEIVRLTELAAARVWQPWCNDGAGRTTTCFRTFGRCDNLPLQPLTFLPIRMRVIVALQALLAKEESLFRAQLLREDIARLTRLQALAHEASDLEGFKRAGKRIGWTQADARTQELAPPLDRLLELIYRFETGPADEALEVQIETGWAALHRLRMERLVGCLSTPVPKPDA